MQTSNRFTRGDSGEGSPYGPAPIKTTPQFGFHRGSMPATTGDTVTVACKLPHGVLLRVFDWEEFDEPMRDGSYKRSKRAIPLDTEFTVRGTWAASAGQAYNRNNGAVSELLPGGYALTYGCPKELWERWYGQNRNTALVQNRIIFAHPDHPTATKEAAKLREVKSGMEPLDPQKPAERMPGGVDRRLRLGILEQGEGTTPR